MMQGIRMKAIARRRFSILGVLLLTLFAAHAFAGIGVWSYAGNNYPTQVAALAAMHAVSGQKAVLTQQSGITAMSSSTATYKYAAPNVNPTSSAWWYCAVPNSICLEGSFEPGAFSSEAAAVASILPVNPCPRTVVPATDWTRIFANLPFVEEIRGYDFTTSEPPACVNPSTSAFGIFRVELANCPTFYVLTQGPIICSDPDTDTISGPLDECSSAGSPSTSVGDPCDVLTGDFSQTETDYSGANLSFQRYYHSGTFESNHTLGVGWTHNYAAYLVLTGGVPTGLLRPNGHHDALTTSTTGVYISLSGAAIHVQQSGANWIATLKDGSSEVYTGTGQLTQLATPGGMITTLTYNFNKQLFSVSGQFGQAIQFSYNASNQLQTLIDPAGNSISYAYDANNNLTSATYQDGTKRTYLYENSTLPNNLTGIVDESNNRFLTVAYDDSTGAVTSS